MALSLLVKRKALEAGFDLAGIAPLAVWQDLDFARRWVEQGYGGEMHYLENPKRSDPRQILPSAKSVICAGLVYNAPLPYSTECMQKSECSSQESGISGQKSPARGWISRYAWGHDYHDVMRDKLEALRKAIENLGAGVETRVYTDTGPIVERAFARYSGIGWTGKNTCLINQTKGSWFFLGVVLTSLELEADLPAPDRCGSCTRCLNVCPTGALVNPYVMDASRCIAYFTIELKGSIPPEFRPAIGANVFGCDICQDVCPWNSQNRDQGLGIRDWVQVADSNEAEKGMGRIGAAITLAPEFQPLEVSLPADAASALHPLSLGEDASLGEAREGSAPSANGSFSFFNPPLEALAQITEQDFRRVFAKSPIKRPKYRGWLRNLCVAMGNSSDTRFLSRLERLCEHDDPIIREHAEWALAQLRAPSRQAENGQASQAGVG